MEIAINVTVFNKNIKTLRSVAESAVWGREVCFFGVLDKLTPYDTPPRPFACVLVCYVVDLPGIKYWWCAALCQCGAGIAGEEKNNPRRGGDTTGGTHNIVTASKRCTH